MIKIYFNKINLKQTTICGLILLVQFTSFAGNRPKRSNIKCTSKGFIDNSWKNTYVYYLHNDDTATVHNKSEDSKTECIIYEESKSMHVGFEIRCFGRTKDAGMHYIFNRDESYIFHPTLGVVAALDCWLIHKSKPGKFM